MRLHRRRSGIMADSNLVSMGDIAFQLIVFFMVAATFARSMSMNVELPSGDESAADDGKSVTLQASASAMVLNEQPVDMKDLDERLRALLADRSEPKDRVVVLVTSDDIPFQRHAQIMHAVRKAGGVVAVMYEEEE
jgi:biopolymer transport protein ExbD